MKTGDGETHRGFEFHTLRQNRKPPNGWLSVLASGRFEPLNAIVLGTIACRQLDGGNTSIFAIGENAYESPLSAATQRVAFCLGKWEIRTIKCNSPGNYCLPPVLGNIYC